MSKQLRLMHLVIILCLSVFAVATHGIASEKDGLLKIYFLDIGQGDAIFIETPGGEQILIDGGPDNKVLSKLGELMPFWDRSLDLIVLSHPHFDHYNGLIEVINRYNVRNIMEAKEEAEEKGESVGFSAWREAIKKEGATEIEPIAGKIINLGEVRLTVLHPFNSVAGERPKNVHDDIVVVTLRYGELEVMLTGDMEDEIERKLIMQMKDIDSDVLKVGHHGSRTSTSEGFLSAASPEVGIIQVGEKNRYGHPSPEVLERLDNYGIKYYRNDINGDIKLISDGGNYLILTEK